MRKGNTKNVLKRVIQVLLSSLIAVSVIGVLVFVTQGRDMPVLDTQGTIANQQRDLIIFTVALGMLVVIPVFILLFAVAWRYREGNTKAKYEPENGSNYKLEALWWGIPCLIIIVLAIVTYVSSHALDPYKPLDSNTEPVDVQVVSLDWKWLFIYPDKGVATLNYLNIPEKTPINFTITSDAPMNSFWIPALGGQVYSMAGMSTKLHLMADTVGTYNGASANISGEGFSSMRFKVHSMTEADFSSWLLTSADSTDMLTNDRYKELAVQSNGDGEKTFMLMNKNLYTDIIMKYMYSTSTQKPNTKDEEMHVMHGDMSGMNM